MTFAHVDTYLCLCPGGQDCLEWVHHARQVTGMNLICYLSLNIVHCQCQSSHTYVSTLFMTSAIIYVCLLGDQKCQEAAPHLEPVIWYKPIYSPSHQPLFYPHLSAFPICLCPSVARHGKKEFSMDTISLDAFPVAIHLSFFYLLIFMISCIIMFAGGHTMSNAPDLFWPPKLSGIGPG